MENPLRITRTQCSSPRSHPYQESLVGLSPPGASREVYGRGRGFSPLVDPTSRQLRIQAARERTPQKFCHLVLEKSPKTPITFDRELLVMIIEASGGHGIDIRSCTVLKNKVNQKQNIHHETNGILSFWRKKHAESLLRNWNIAQIVKSTQNFRSREMSS